MHIQYHFFLMITIVLFNDALAQPFPIKERFDWENGIYSTYSNFDNVSDPGQQYASTEGLGYVLESLIAMYETTKDKAYLIKFIGSPVFPMKEKNVLVLVGLRSLLLLVIFLLFCRCKLPHFFLS